MANHAYAKTGKEIDPEDLNKRVEKLIAEKLGGLFSIERNEKENSWFILAKCDKKISFMFWISDEEEYGEYIDGEFVEYKKSKILSKNSVIEFRHGHGFSFMWWVESVVRENLGKQYNARMFDDGCEINPKANPDRCETFEKSCSLNDDMTIRSKKEIKASKRMWFGWYAKFSSVPKELIEGLKLDFKIK